jgi:hypothetical protein
MAPYVARARASWPGAKARYLAGLPRQTGFFVTARLRDLHGRQEQVFIAVDTLRSDSIFGRIWSEISLVEGFHLRQRYSLPEADLIDWLITKPDGTEEGNVVGIFLDTYRP